MFVKLKETVAPAFQLEHKAALRELSPTGAYKVVTQQLDQGEMFYTLQGGMTPHSAYLFEEVPTGKKR